jgi:uncharacterized protein YcnI
VRSAFRDPRVLLAVGTLVVTSVALGLAACGTGGDTSTPSLDASGKDSTSIDSTAIDSNVSASDAGVDANACAAFTRPPEGTYSFDLTPSTPVTGVLTLPLANDGGIATNPVTVTSPFTGTVTYDEAGTGWTLVLSLIPGERTITSHFVQSASGVTSDHYEEFVICATAVADCPAAQTLTCPPVTSNIGCTGVLNGTGFCALATSTPTFGVTGHHFTLSASDSVTLGDGEILPAYYYQDTRTLTGVYNGVETVYWELSPSSGMVLKMEVSSQIAGPLLGSVATFNQPPLTFVLHSSTPSAFDAGALDAGKD